MYLSSSVSQNIKNLPIKAHVLEVKCKCQQQRESMIGDSGTPLAFLSFCGALQSSPQRGLIQSWYSQSLCASAAQAGSHAASCPSVDYSGNWSVILMCWGPLGSMHFHSMPLLLFLSSRHHPTPCHSPK